MKQLASKIKAIRLKAQLNQADFARSIGVNQSALSQIEKTGSISVRTIAKICEKYKVPFSSLMNNERIPDEYAMQLEISHLKEQIQLLNEIVRLRKKEKD